MENDRKLLNIQEFLPYQLVSLSTKVSNDFAQVYEQQGQLTQPQWRTLSHTIHHQGITARAICDLANMDKSTVSRAIKQLQQRGLVALSENSQDKRAKLVVATAEGMELYRLLTPLARQWETLLLDCFTTEQKAQFAQLLAILDGKLAKQE